MILYFLIASLNIYWSLRSSSWTISGYLHSTIANLKSDIYVLQLWPCFCFIPQNLNLLRVWLLSGLNILSRFSNTVLGLSSTTFIECSVMMHCHPIQFMMRPAFWTSFISDRGPWNKTLHFCLNCSNSDRQSFTSQSNLGLLNCIAILSV